MILISDRRVLQLVSPHLTVHFKEESLVSVWLFKLYLLIFGHAGSLC